MSTKTIPAQTIKSCDSCGTVMDRNSARQSGALILKADALDMQGAACADATRTLDLCDRCLYAVGKAIDATITAEQSKKEPGP